MNLFNNPEIKNQILIVDFIFLPFILVGFFINLYSGLLFILSMILIDISIVFFCKRRFLKVQGICENIDKVLYGQKDILISDCKEGEFSILENEISKMTIKLKEQSDLLLADKKNLTNAIADIFHQLRTPLTSININLALLEEEELSYEERLSLTRKLYKQVERIQWLVESLLKISKIDSKTAEFYPKEVTIENLINKALDPLLVTLDIRNINVKKEIEGDKIEIDLNWTVEAIGNILKNCMEHTNDGGEISIKITDSPLFTQMIISDTGEGFSEEDIPHLFERFFNGKNATKESIGIGLSLAQMIITAQNGTISARNCPSGGALFEIKFYKTII